MSPRHFRHRGGDISARGGDIATSPKQVRNRDEEQGRKQGENTRATLAPEKLAITERMRAWAVEKAPLTLDDLEEVTEKFLNHHGAKGTVFLDWTKAWYTWVGNEQRYRKERGQNASRNGQTRVEAIEEAGAEALEMIRQMKQQGQA